MDEPLEPPDAIAELIELLDDASPWRWLPGVGDSYTWQAPGVTVTLDEAESGNVWRVQVDPEAP